MIDKKPFRVTNEELNMLEEMSDAEIGEKMGLVKFIRKLSADLLDARELIDKQEAIIKELHGAINNAYKSDGSEKAISFIIAEYESILEKTKEYI